MSSTHKFPVNIFNLEGGETTLARDKGNFHAPGKNRTRDHPGSVVGTFDKHVVFGGSWVQFSSGVRKFSLSRASMISPPSKLKMFTGSVCVLLTSASLKLIKIKIKLIYATTSSWEKNKNGGWKLSDTDWFYFSFYSRSCFFSIIQVFFLWSKLIRVQFYFILFFSSIRVGPSRFELIPPGLASELIRSDLYLPVLKYQKLHIFRSRFTHLVGGPRIFGFLLVSLFWSWLKEVS